MNKEEDSRIFIYTSEFRAIAFEYLCKRQFHVDTYHFVC